MEKSFQYFPQGQDQKEKKVQLENIIDEYTL